MLVALAAAVALMCGVAAPAYANPLTDAANAVVSFFTGDQNADEGVSTQAVDDADHTVAGVSPRGTTINVFDYWIQGREDADNRDWGTWQYYQEDVNAGINQNHALKFSKGAEKQNDVANFNKWTNSATPFKGIVANELGEDGYPVLNQQTTGSSESLAYLFDMQSGASKQACSDVDGLLQVDDDGYYYYNSQQNYAQFNDDGNGSGDFTLYEKGGVTAGGSSPYGQFFPFNSGDDVFDETWSGELTDAKIGNDGHNIVSTDAVMNHYFGLSMSTRFVQQDGGWTAPEGTQGRQQVTYNFSGDDDVWVYIDGVLVGDLGGIHNKTSLEINFADGHVYVYDDANNNNQWDHQGEDCYANTTIGDIMTAAGVGNGLNGNTFADNTYHTLDFFYLERGNTDSNMSLKYNLVNIPESGVVKVDQMGNEMGGVSFTLHEANANYEIADNNGDGGAMEVSGRTDANGKMVFTTTNGAGQEMPITLEQLQEQGGDYWVLTEDGAPDGYRSNGDVHLRFEDGVLLASNEWDTGAYSQPHVTAIAPTQVRKTHSGTMENSADGTMFAVVFQKGADGDWYPVYGDAFSGWTVSDTNDMTAVVTAAQADPNQFLLGSGGAYEATIEDLPGDITTYAFMLKKYGGDEDDAQYTVRYYWSSADSMLGVNAGNTTQIDADADASYEGMDRIFSVTLNIPNIKNELSLVKTDRSDNNAAMQGVEFKLFADEDRNGVADDGTALSTLTTDENGELQVYSDADEQILAKGNYVLEETTPEGYQEETEPIQIVVDDEGVHVNAGAADDNVTVETGIGSLVYSMKGFAAGDQVDATLHDVKAQAQTATEYTGENTTWTPGTSAAESHFQYDAQAANLSYVLNGSVENNGGATYIADAGWSRLNLQQCMNHSGDAATGPKQDLAAEGVADINALFTGAVTIHMTNAKIPTTSSLTISKTVTGEGAPADKTFDFNFTLTDADGNPVTGTFSATTHHADGSDTTADMTIEETNNEFALGNGESVTISGLPIGATYTVTETATAYYDPSVTPAGTIDKTTGNLTTTGAINETAANNNVVFTNAFWGGSVDYDYATDVNIAKTFKGRDMKQGEKFTVNVRPNDDQSAQLFGLSNASEKLTIPFTNLDDGVKSSVDLLASKDIKFTKDNAGTYVYTVSEERPADNPSDGITYDETVYTLTIAVSADNDGVVTVKTSATDDKDFNEEVSITGDKHVNTGIELPFTNTYNAEGELGGNGDASIAAHKTLVNDALEGNDFTFGVWSVDQSGSTVDELATAQNDADGNIVFPAIKYTTNSLKQDVTDGVAQEGVDDNGNATYSYTYRVMEETTGFADEGLSTATAQFDVQVVVTDNGDGTLGIAVAYPEGSENGLEFVNTYGASAEAQLNVAGTKIYETNGLENAPKIEGKYTFTLTGVDEDGQPAPLPAGAQGNAATTTNQANGTVDFGTIDYDIADLGGADSKTFTYRVTEAGEIDGVDNDAAATEGKTFQVTLTDNQDGTISVDADAQQAAGHQFSFTNTYDADPTVPSNPTDPTTGNLTISKTLEGSTLNEGEFSFTVAAAGDYGDAVSPASITATNTVNGDGTGSVVFGDGFTFTKPGDYTFTISEDNNGLGGVTYDGAAYTAVAHVEDNGVGALTVSWKVTNAAGESVEHITFANSYEAAPTGAVPLQVTKELKDGTLADGQFTFELTGSEGAPLPGSTTVTNSADGTVSFGAVTFDKVGEYDYTVTEVNDGQNGITYDENADRTIHVSVTDDGEGHLVAEVTYGEDGSHFVNTDTTGGDNPGGGDEPGTDPGENPGGDPGDGNGNGGGNGSGEGSGSGNGYTFAQTNDATPWPIIAIVALGAVAVIAVAAFSLRRVQR